MRNVFRITVYLFFLLLVSSSAFAAIISKSRPDRDIVLNKLTKLQIPFIENKGQIQNESIRFYANTFAGTAFVSDKGDITYSITKRGDEVRTRDLKNKIHDPETLPKEETAKTVVIRESLLCPEETTIRGLNPSETKINHFVGSNKDNWKKDIPSWQEVSIGEVYKGVELKLRAYGKNVEKLFTVQPGGSVSDISMRIEGAKELTVNKDGELEINTELGTVKMTKPVAYQEVEGNTVEVEVKYILPESALLTQNSKLYYSFHVAEYDHTNPLIIDPLLASTFVGGGNIDGGEAIITDSSGNVIITGETNYSPYGLYPTTPGAYDTILSDGGVLFVSKLDSNLSTLLVSTYIGGTDRDYVYSVAMDSSGDIFIAGTTYSTDYPTTSGAYDTVFSGYYTDAFISKFDSTLSSLLSSTFLGNSNIDGIKSMVIDSSDNIYVVGETQGMPTTQGAYDRIRNACSSCPSGFVSKLNNDLSNLIASTYIEGYGGAHVEDVALDASEEYVFITGYIDVQPGHSFYYPTTEYAYDASRNGGDWDGFVSKLRSDLAVLAASTYIGGSGDDFIYSLAVDSIGNVFITGYTTSSDYPVTSGAYDMTYDIGGNNGFDSIVSKFDSGLSLLPASTFIGGSDDDVASSLAIDTDDKVFITGWTNSSDYPVTIGAYDTIYNPADSFLSKFSNDLSGLSASTFIGPGDSNSVAIDPSGNILITGYTTSGICENFPTTITAYDKNCAGADVFISKFDNDLSESPDSDGDSFTTDVDCDDNDANIYPGGPSARITGTTPAYYLSLQNAYDAASTGDTIQSQNTTFVGDMFINLAKTVIITGGYDCGYVSPSGKTSIKGNMYISYGKVTLENIEIKK